MAQPASPRFLSFDALRGLIMILMAIDHSSAFISRQHSNEFYNGAISIYSSTPAFLTRLLTHLCAPGFFFLLGASIYWFAASRRLAGWSESQILRRTVLRGFVLFLTGQILETPVLYLQTLLSPAAERLSRLPMPPPNDASSLSWGFITLAGLGMVSIFCGLLLPLRPSLWLAVSALCTLATHTLLPTNNQPGPIPFALLLSPGLTQHVVVVYPAIPWLAVASFGMFFAHSIQQKQSPGSGFPVWRWGLALTLLALTLRLTGAPGNLTLPRDSSWIEFLNNVKYPPSLVFWTLSVGVNLLLLAAIQRLPAALQSPRSPLMVYGQTPLFFYLTHFYLLAAIGILFFPIAPPLAASYAIWLLALVLLYPLCLFYRAFKSSQPQQSFWRLF